MVSQKRLVRGWLMVAPRKGRHKNQVTCSFAPTRANYYYHHSICHANLLKIFKTHSLIIVCYLKTYTHMHAPIFQLHLSLSRRRVRSGCGCLKAPFKTLTTTKAATTQQQYCWPIAVLLTIRAPSIFPHHPPTSTDWSRDIDIYLYTYIYGVRTDK